MTLNFTVIYFKNLNIWSHLPYATGQGGIGVVSLPRLLNFLGGSYKQLESRTKALGLASGIFFCKGLNSKYLMEVTRKPPKHWLWPGCRKTLFWKEIVDCRNLQKEVCWPLDQWFSDFGSQKSFTLLKTTEDHTSFYAVPKNYHVKIKTGNFLKVMNWK